MNVETASWNIVKSSQPQLVHSSSQQSLAASDHSSFSDYASGASSIEHRSPTAQYETPPSRAHSPIAIEPAESEMTLPARPVLAHSAPLNARRGQVPHMLIPPPAALYRDTHNISPPTPGMDESPYIRFAIEQLTRDEELLGRGRQGSISSLEYPVDRIIPDEGLGYYNAPAPQTQARQPPRRPPNPPAEAKQPSGDDVFLPVDPSQRYQHPRLGYLPIILRTPFLLLLICICLLMMIGLIFCNIYSLRNDGLYDYDGTGTPSYFVFEFMPQLLGMVIVFWVFVLQAAVYRIIPFASMSSQRFLDRALQDMSIYPANFLVPDLSHFKCGESVVGMSLVAFWILYFTVPLLGCMFQTQLFDVDGAQQWRWTSVQVVVWVLVVLYMLLTAAIILLLLRFRRRQPALMWDPVSLADLIPLFRRSNIISDLDGSEISESIRAHIPPRPLRLGYWTTSRSAEIFYTIGEENAPARRPSREQGVQNEKSLSGFDSQNFDLEYQRYSHAESFTRNIHSPFFRYRWAPWFLRDSAVVAWIITALVLYLVFLIISFVNQAVERGFVPRLQTVTNSRGFSASNFLFGFLPSLLGMILFLAWQPIDMYFRAIQPFARLADPKGAAAEHSLLLAYPSCYPIEVTLLALINRDFKVAWISFIGLASLAIPVLAGGIFTAQFFDQSQVRIAATMPAYHALCVFLAIYVFSFLLIWPKRKRYLPHRIDTLADHLSFLYQSPLLVDPAFRSPKTKADLVSRLVVSRTKGAAARRSTPRYAFGIYIGRDGKEHLGIDRLLSSGSGEMSVDTSNVRPRGLGRTDEF